VLTAGGTLFSRPGTVRCPLRFVPAVHHRNVDLSFRRRCRAACSGKCLNACPCALI